MTRLPIAAGALVLAAVAAARAEDLVETLGKQRAAKSPLGWDIREAGHPVLGPVRFAFLKAPIVTPVGANKVFSNVYLSCETNARKIAIELSNSTAPDDPSGLKPHALPRLVCNDLAAPNDPRLVQDDITAHWEVNSIGDALARGLSPFALRECVSIAIIQDVVLPKGWTRPDAPIEFEITPYTRELDAIFATCGEKTAYAQAPAARSAPRAAPPAPPAGALSQRIETPPGPSTEEPWKQARTTSRGRTNVRAKPTLDSAVVVEIDPGDVILVQRTGTLWWRAKSRPNARKAFEGYIRQDRLVFK
jgi:hypothetical protein